MPRLSILIPCLGGSAEFDETLVSVLQHRPPKCEVIVAHTAAYDDPYGLSGEVDFLHCPDETTLVGLINAALDAAASPIVHVLACGLQATEGWTETAVRHLDDDEIAAVVPAVMTADGTQLASAGVRLTAAGSRAVVRDERLLAGGSGHLRAAIGAPTLSAGFYRRDVLEVLGGFDGAATDGLADVDLATRLRAMELRVAFEPDARLRDSIGSLRHPATGAIARGRAIERLFWQSAPAIAWSLSLALHSLAVLADPAAIAGRILALAEIGSAARHRRHMTEAKARLDGIRASRAQNRPPIGLPAARRRAA